MKKKWFLALLTTVLSLTLASCTNSEKGNGGSSTVPEVNSQEEKDSSKTESSLDDALSEADTSTVDNTNTSSDPIVYMTTSINSDRLVAAYEALERIPAGKVAVKVSTGEAGNNNYLDPNLIKDLVQNVNGTIIECNTAYGGSRDDTAMHLQVAEDHGFTAIADVDIMDETGSIRLPVIGGTYLKENLVGKNIENYDFIIVLSHFKGHALGGFGGALKNTSIGIASSEGKNIIHTAGETNMSWIPYDNSRFNVTEGEDHNGFIMAMAEAAKSVSDYKSSGEKMLYINVMNHLSVDCDCDGNPAEPDMHDIGILASLDPVALDQACVDMVYKSSDGASLIERIESRNGTLILEHAENIGLGSRSYQLISIDD